jgi:hypothetical protein
MPQEEYKNNKTERLKIKILKHFTIYKFNIHIFVKREVTENI